jgi:segregation and condensation protein B
MPQSTTPTEGTLVPSDQTTLHAAAPEAGEIVVVPTPQPDAPPSKRGRAKLKAAALADVVADPSLAPKLEAILVSLDRAVPAVRIAEGLGLLAVEDGASESAESDHSLDKAQVAAAARHVDLLVDLLNQQYTQTSRAFRIELLAGGYRLMTLAEHASVLVRFHKQRHAAKLSRPAVESLAIIAYKQPITRAELESIRGVSCGEVLRTLLERRLVAIKGRAEELGRPMIYGTTPEFLAHFGLASIKDLPAPAELKLPS